MSGGTPSPGATTLFETKFCPDCKNLMAVRTVAKGSVYECRACSKRVHLRGSLSTDPPGSDGSSMTVDRVVLLVRNYNMSGGSDGTGDATGSSGMGGSVHMHDPDIVLGDVSLPRIERVCPGCKTTQWVVYMTIDPQRKTNRYVCSSCKHVWTNLGY